MERSKGNKRKKKKRLAFETWSFGLGLAQDVLEFPIVA